MQPEQVQVEGLTGIIANRLHRAQQAGADLVYKSSGDGLPLETRVPQQLQNRLQWILGSE
jgi:hypothetical protein